MKAAAIIAEYNPFHNGHCLQINFLRQQGYTHVVAVMSGHFVQRGEGALFSKWVRAQAALINGVDLVLELPIGYSVAGAETFAKGGVAILQKLGCIDALCFGCETDDLAALTRVADVLDTPQWQQRLTGHLQKGLPFAQAREEAVRAVLGDQFGALLRQPNAILGVEYIKWLRRFGCNIAPLPLKRQHVGHDSIQTHQNIASASFVRQTLLANKPQTAKAFVPQNVWALYADAWQNGQYCSPHALDIPLFYTLRSMPLQDFCTLPDISEGLQNRLYQAAGQATNLEEFFALAKTRRYSMARLRRIALAALLKLQKDDTALLPPYLRVLGLTNAGRELLRKAKTTCTAPLAMCLADAQKMSAIGAHFAQKESFAADIYYLAAHANFPRGQDFKDNALILP